MNVLLVLLGILLGLLFSFGIFLLQFSDNGGNLLIDPKNGVFRVQLNLDDIEDWGDQKFVILKVSKSSVSLRRLEDIKETEFQKEHSVL